MKTTVTTMRIKHASVFSFRFKMFKKKAYYFRNVNIRDILAILPILVQQHGRGPGGFGEGPAERTFQFLTKFKDKKCIKFTFGDGEESRDWWKLVWKICRGMKYVRGNYQTQVPYRSKTNLCFCPCLQSQMKTFQFNTAIFMRECV